MTTEVLWTEDARDDPGAIFHLSPNAVSKWIKAFAQKQYEKPASGDAILIESDEMWHF